ncbi:MAG: iron ABC transporter permease, partial [Rhodospirillales bacterium]
MVRGERILLLALVLLVGLLSVLPMARLLMEALAPRGVPDLSVVARVWNSPATWRATTNTLWVAAGGTVAAVLLGALFALLIGLTDVR